MEHTATADDRERRSTRADRRSTRRRDRSASDRDPVGAVHRSVGNQAVQALHERGAIQAKLEVSRPGDAAEREAERFAAQVLRTERAVDAPGGAPTDGGSGAGPAGGGNGHAVDTDRTVDAETEAQIEALRGNGRPLRDATRTFFESRFGRDFGDVRVHTDARAHAAAQSIDAEAFTYGADIAFASGNYDPGSRSGKKLLAHELTHVVQQDNGRVVDRVQRYTPGPGGEAVPVNDRGFADQITNVIDREVEAYNNLTVDADVDRVDTGDGGAGGNGGEAAGGDGDGGGQRGPGGGGQRQGDGAAGGDAAIGPTLGVFMPGAVQEETMVSVEATYFINTEERGDTHRQREGETVTYTVGGEERERGTANFTGDSRAVKQQVSENADHQFRTTMDNTYSKGRAVELGKASPGTLEDFIQEAWDQGAIHTYAETNGIPDVEGTPNLDNVTHAQKAIQDYVNKTGIGVDCSGFVTHMLTEIRRSMDEEGDTALPSGERADQGEVRVANRNASQFASEGDPVSRPGALEPGDVWVKNDGAHIVIISEVPGATSDGYEFETAESSSSGAVTLGNTPDEGISTETYTAESAAEFGDDATIADHIDPAGDDGFYSMGETGF